ncbi:hypothetical protein [Glaciibacter superstes]|uniref:hypothetical protein n=1 Tax=Glaciibacter superstes TaxID=501023 RepID=UPI0003B3AE37|nr:hypothetical protein [Glaciibacter superstes]
MTTALAPHRDRQGAARARQAVLASRDRFWQPSDLQLSPSTVHHLLGDLEDRGELRRIRRGLYWRGTKTPLGMAPPSPERLVEALTPGAGVGPAGLSAANALRLSTQVPRRAQIAVPDRAPSDAGAVMFVSRAARTGRAATRLTPTEVAMLEVLDDWPALVEVELAQATRQLTELLRSGIVRAERLADAATTEPGQTRARLRALLTAAGRSDLADRVPAADRRTESAALATLAFA